MKYVRSFSSVSEYMNDLGYFAGAFRKMREIEMNSVSQLPRLSIDQ
jgi:hypothetical protein